MPMWVPMWLRYSALRRSDNGGEGWKKKKKSMTTCQSMAAGRGWVEQVGGTVYEVVSRCKPWNLQCQEPSNLRQGLVGLLPGTAR